MADQTERGAFDQTTGISTADYEYNTLMRLLGVSVSKHLLDEHFTLVWANDFYYQLIGWSKDEYEAAFHNRPDLYYTNDREEWELLTETVMGALAEHKSGYKLVSRIRRKNGEYVWVQFSTQFADEYIDGYQVAYSVLTNIDDLVRMQREQTVTYESLPGFVAKYRIDRDLNMVLLESNARFLDYFGGESVRGENPLYKKNIKDNWDVISDQKEMMLAGEPLHFVMRVQSRQDKIMWLQVNATCVEWQNKCPVYLAIFIDITDVTELREMQKKLQNALAAEEHANKAKSDFLSRMSHDIRTPMNAILGMTTIAGAHIDDPDRVADCLGKITVSSKLLLSLINEILDMSKIESGRIVLSEEEVNLAELVHGVVTMVQPQIHSKNLVFKTYISDLTHETVVSDMQRLQQLLMNLLTNAVKYTHEEGSVLLEISENLSERPGMAHYKFIVSDTGIGMRPDFLHRIFQPFERADDEEIQSVQGTGLGLSICKYITELMNGTLEVESEYGKGSRFTATVYLKVHEDVPDDSKLAGLSVLVVDDDEMICRNTCDRLESLGIHAEWVTDGAAAVKMVTDSHESGQDYFAVIIDYKMPKMDGITVTRLIREQRGESLPIIMISAYDLSEHIDAAKQAGANGFITKPLFRSRLIYKLKQFVEGAVKEERRLPLLADRCYEGRRILLVEDNELNQEIAVEILRDMGIDVETADNGKAALDMVTGSDIGYYDLIFMDMQMPVMDGCTAARKIRALGRRDMEMLPIIAMTANAFEDDRKKTKDAGMNGHLEKPLDMEQLQQVLEKWLRPEK
jgi:two-component system sensor histidine kinase/response regulator